MFRILFFIFSAAFAFGACASQQEQQATVVGPGTMSKMPDSDIVVVQPDRSPANSRDRMRVAHPHLSIQDMRQPASASAAPTKHHRKHHKKSAHK